MKIAFTFGAACLAAVVSTSALAAPITFNFEATQTSAVAPITPPTGSATEFALGAASVTGSFTYDPDAAIVASNTSAGFDVAVRAGASITLETTLGPETVSGNATIIDGRDQFSDSFSLVSLNGPETFSIQFRAVNTLLTSTDFPTALSLPDFLSARFLVTLFDPFDPSSDDKTEAMFDITSLTAAGPTVVPLPASSLLLLGGLAGLGALRRRKAAA